MARTLPIAALVLSLVCSGPVDARTNPCIAAADRAAQESDVPLSVMRAVTLAETGRTGPDGFAPWPWAVQTGGRGAWFDTAAEALSFAQGRIAQGVDNFDLGCFQLNYAWHGENFASLEAMLDPDTNAAYAASFLARLHAESGDWRVAVGRFHSRNPQVSEPYVTRLKAIYVAQLDREPEGPRDTPTRKTRRDPSAPPMGFARGPLIEARARPLMERP